MFPIKAMNKKIIVGIIIVGISIIVIISTIFVLNSYKSDYYDSTFYGGIRLAENDKLCITSMVIYHPSMGHKEIEQHIREEIAKFGSQYDFPEREITIKQNSDSVTIKILGIWRQSDTGDRPNLHKALSNLFDVELGGSGVMICE